jgi:hypothetical protein
MHEQIVAILFIGLLVRLGGESCEPVLVDVHPERIDAIDQYINAQIILEGVNQVWLEHVSLHHHLVSVLDLLPLACDVDTFALARVFRLHNVGHVPLLRILPKILIVVGQHISLGKEIVVV